MTQSPQPSAEVPGEREARGSSLMRWADAYAADYAKDGKLAGSRIDLESRIRAALAAPVPAPELPPLPDVGYLGDDVSYGYDSTDMRDYALEAIRAARPHPAAPEAAPGAGEGMFHLRSYGDVTEAKLLALTATPPAAPEALQLTDAQILDTATALWPRWREEIQERFVLTVVRAALAAEREPLTDAQILEGYNAGIHVSANSFRDGVHFAEKHHGIVAGTTKEKP